MPKFKLEMHREVTTRDSYEIEIEAENLESAQTQAEEMAGEMNHDCPDDVQPTGYFVCHDWTVDSVSEKTDAETSAAHA